LNKCYRVEVGTVNGQRQQRTKGKFATKDAALTAMAKLQKDVGDGTHVEGSRLTVGDYLRPLACTATLAPPWGPAPRIGSPPSWTASKPIHPRDATVSPPIPVVY